MNDNDRHVIDEFHKLTSASRVDHGRTLWLGAQVTKSPLDCWVYQEIIYEVQPDVIIECGTFGGGSALFFASICDLIGKGRVITIDIQALVQAKFEHPRIKYLLGTSSVSSVIIERVREMVGDAETVMVNLDSEHNKSHVLQEILDYQAFVTVGSYLIVEDTNVNGHPIMPEFGPGPMEAVQEFLSTNDDFVIDKSREKFMLTFNPNGYLKRVKKS